MTTRLESRDDASISTLHSSTSENGCSNASRQNTKQQVKPNINRVSKARGAQNAKYLILRRSYLIANRQCETHHVIFPGERGQVARDIHHTHGRIGSLLLDESKWRAVCRNCHHWIGSFVKRARELGLIAPAGEWNKTARTNHLRREV